MTLYLFKFNNYYNRIVKKYDTIEEYSANGTLLETFEGITNWNPNDGISTTQIINYQGDIPDYVLVVKDNEIDSRWFVIESKRTRAQQFEIELYRDVIADWYDEIVDAPCYIEKAILNQSDPLIFNNEGMTFNQIKTSETLIKDETNSAWLVGYCTRDTEETSISAEIKYNDPVDIALTNITAYEYYDNSNLSSNPQPLTGYPTKIIYNVYAKHKLLGQTYLNKISFNEKGGETTGNYIYDSIGSITSDRGQADINTSYNFTGPAANPTGTRPNFESPLGSFFTGYESDFSSYDYFIDGFKKHYATLKSQLPAYLPIQSEADTINILNQNGKTIYDSTNDKYYKITVETIPVAQSEIMITSGSMYNTFVSAMNDVAKEYDSLSWHDEGEFFTEEWLGQPTSGSFSVRVIGNKYNIILTELPNKGLTYSVSFPDDRYQLEDAPYDLFCMPFSDDLNIYKNGVFQFKSDKSLAWQTFMALATKYKAANFIYDIQLLPYCPVRYCLTPSKTFDIGSNIVGNITKTENGTSSNVGYILFGTKASDSFVVPYNITVEDNKIQSQTDSWRLVSPNYSGQFEFNAAKNDGVEYIDIDYTYKPFTPYIHLSPNFKNLYGQDFNDARGLICGGDYSLPSTSSAWETYELQNKNYQLAFDRQIQNMEVNNSVQRTLDAWNIGTGTVQGLTTGGMGGFMVGGPVGAGVGGTIGGLTSLAGGIADYYLNEKLRNEAIDFTKDQFGYSLGNIQALPYTLNKVSAFNQNNKIFPFIEYYTCTETEKQALINKIKYNGMTTEVIGKISDYKDNTYRDFDRKYIKGKLIRLENISDDFHVVNVISNELNKGVYL